LVAQRICALPALEFSEVIEMKMFMRPLVASLAVLALAACEGSAGTAGSAGAKGDTGAAGVAGAKGDKGDKGDTGAAGVAGAKGDKGDKGDTGAAGVAGAKGDTGAAGAAGAKGDKGDTGAAGAAGAKGDKGDTGATGAKGDKGETGASGAKGDAGQDWPGPAPAAYLAADGIKGGVAYSEWYATGAGGKGSLANANVTAGAEFVRCKTCHGWDGLGNAGSYANRTGISTGEATRADVSDVNLRATVASASYQDLYDLIESTWGRPINAANDSRHPAFAGHLEPAQIWNIVKFMREEWVDPNELYDLAIVGAPLHYEDVAGVWTLKKPTLTFTNLGKDGDAVAGKTLYAAKCAGCHNSDGKLVLLEKGTMTLGQFVRGKPHEAWFKIKFGQGAVMLPGLVTATSDLKNLYKAMADTTAYPNL